MFVWRFETARLAAFLLLAVAAAVWASCRPVDGTSPFTRQMPDSSSSAPSSREGMVTIQEGEFVYGASEEQFQLFLAGTKVNFPGMRERLRKMFVIPPVRKSLETFLIDEFEVTNEEFSNFVTSSGYVPINKRSYLKHWSSGTRYPEWAATFPVVWVSPEDARSFCEWSGKRLPTDQEWEKAARGPDGRMFPWGNQAPEGNTTNAGTGKLEPVGNRPGDRSPYGVYDLAGNVSELTATVEELEGRNLHTVRGGSHRSGVRELLTYQRLLGVGAHQRSESIGFRCAADAKP